MSAIRFLVSPGKRIAMLFLTMIVGLIATGFISYILTSIMPEKPLAAMRIATMVQDILVFILPPVVTALIVTRQSVKLLTLQNLPDTRMSLAAIMLLFASTPLMSWIVDLNQNVHLPESMAALESALRTMEDSAASTVEFMMGPATPVNLIVNLLIVGIAAGFSEELFFRAGLQRLLVTARIKPWVAIWISAFVFSAFHMQFFGFVPRLLLGALFGYLLVWSGSVWLPMLVHTLNNSMYVILRQTTGSGDISPDSAAASWPAVAASLAVTGALLWYMHSIRKSPTVKPDSDAR